MSESQPYRPGTFGPSINVFGYVAVKIWICREFTQEYHILKIVLDFDL